MNKTAFLSNIFTVKLTIINLWKLTIKTF